MRVDTVPDAKIEHPRDAVIRITACAICGSDLHLLDGDQPTMESGDIAGHETLGVVMEVGSAVSNRKVGDRVVVPFTISCRPVFRLRPDQPQGTSGGQGDGPLARRPVRLQPHAGGYSGGQAE